MKGSMKTWSERLKPLRPTLCSILLGTVIGASAQYKYDNRHDFKIGYDSDGLSVIEDKKFNQVYEIGWKDSKLVIQEPYHIKRYSEGK
jgi:hypothetical protein